MFRNWIDPWEPLHLLQRLRGDPLLRTRMFARLRFTHGGRVVSCWSHTGGPPVHWWDIPLVQARINRLVTGEAGTSYHHYVAHTYLPSGRSSRALSLGCGSGVKELQWAATGRFHTIDAYDISDHRVGAAVDLLHTTPYQEMIRYRVGDGHRLRFAAESYDVVLFDHSLHHFSSLGSLLPRVHDALRPGGILVANEFIGPSRFQWTDRQLEAVHGILATFPRRYTTRWGSDVPRERVRRPSKLLLWLSDPSEAAESSEITPLIRKHFEVLEQRGYGGALLHLLFSGIAHHFVSPDAGARRLLESAFALEDALLDRGEIDHDFALLIARKGG